MATKRWSITLDGAPVTVIGVLPETFDFGAIFAPGAKVDLFSPIVMDDIRMQGNTLALFGRLKPDAVSAYYGGGIHGTKNEKPQVPTMLHFGDKDMHIPMTHVNELRKLHPDVQQLGQRGRLVEHGPVEVVRVQVARHRVGREVLREGGS